MSERLRIRGTSLRRVVGLAAATAVMCLLAGCAGQHDENVEGRVDSRVLSAVTPIPGSDSYYDRIWVVKQLNQWQADIIRKCLEQNGRKDLWPRAEEPIMTDAVWADHRTLSKKMLNDTGYDWRRAPDAHASIHENDKVLWDCSGSFEEETPSEDSKRSQLFEDLQSAWKDELDKVLDDPKYSARKQEINKCLEAGGAQINSHDDGSTGAGWEAEFVYGAASKDDMTDEQAKTAGKLLVKCAEPLWDEWSGVLEPKRADFAEKHAKDLADLSAAVDHTG
ncbi:hypothetical protein [Brevibacterium otitidis]|uniref:Lipoprotein n=1 Tax=Brevibacterium otitidis TaxID=53364 RepID=A0ABV5X0B8_9MICO|nr:hypothetical protein GCM10023233_07190 [Brevibacterium otitidis]